MNEVDSPPVSDRVDVPLVEVIEPEAEPEAIRGTDTPKLKGRKRLLQSLQRLSSSPSITRFRSSSSSSYRGTGRGSVSCVSLNTASLASYGTNPASASASRNFLNHFSTAPNSALGTPGLDTPYYITGSGRWTPVHHAAPSPTPRTPLSVSVTAGSHTEHPITAEDYFSLPVRKTAPKPGSRFDFWRDLPFELRMHVLAMLEPKEIVRCSAVSKAWHKMCFDGQLWYNFDTQAFYKDIPAEGLANIIKQAGPFVKDLNLRNCVQLWKKWQTSGLIDACRNLENLSLQDSGIDRSSVNTFLNQNINLQHINLSNLKDVTNSTMSIIADNCPRLEILNVEWCANVDTGGLRFIIESCMQLRELRAGETQGWDDISFLDLIFERNTLERLTLPGCESLQDESLHAIFEGSNSEIDYISGRRIAPSRNLKHVNLARCHNITDTGLRSLVNNVPYLEGLQVSKCNELTDASLRALLPTTPFLTHLDIDELDLLTNATLQELAQSPCKDTLQHLCISYCVNLGDSGMLPVVKACQHLTHLDLDNTKISDLTLAEAAAQVSQRPAASQILRSVTWDGTKSANSGHRDSRRASLRKGLGSSKPKIGLHMTVFDCPNVTWTGIREVLSRNAEVSQSPQPFNLVQAPVNGEYCSPSSSHDSLLDDVEQTEEPTILREYGLHAFPAFHAATTSSVQSKQIIALKVFHGYQQTVQEHTRRVLRGDFAAASRLERKWAGYMMASEEAGAALGVGTGGGTGNINARLGALGLAGNRRRRRRVRELSNMHADETAEGLDGGGGAEAGGAVIGRRRRARTAGGCVVM